MNHFLYFAQRSKTKTLHLGYGHPYIRVHIYPLNNYTADKGQTLYNQVSILHYIAATYLIFAPERYLAMASPQIVPAEPAATNRSSNSSRTPCIEIEL